MITQERLAPYTVRLKGGRNYLNVAGRLLLFREQHANWSISTAIVKLDLDAGHAVIQATISDENGNIVAMATGSETARDFPDGWIEKAETKGVGRALVFAGFGTDAAGYDLDEGERYADAPQPSRQASRVAGQGQQPRGQAPQGPGPVAEARNAFDDVANEHDIVFQSGQERGRMANVILGRPADSRDPFTAEDWRRAAEGVGRYVAGAVAVGAGEAEDEDDTLTDPFAGEESA